MRIDETLRCLMQHDSKTWCFLYTLFATGYILAPAERETGLVVPTATGEKNGGGLFLKGLLKLRQYNQ